MTPNPSMHYRTQWSVGQGGFHSASLRTPRGVFNYLYDCGSSSRGAIDPAVDAFVESLGDDAHLDAIFLSHIDQDHVNGLPTLLGQVVVDRVFLPLLTPLERLAAVANPEQNTSPFGIDMASDPVSAIQGLDAEVDVVTISPSEGPADAGDGQPLDDSGPERTSSPFTIVGRDGDWVPVGRHHVDMSTRAIFRLDRGGVASPWLISLYIAQEPLDQFGAFQDNLSKRLGEDPAAINSWLTPDRIRTLLITSQGLDTVRGAYRDCRVSPNRSSMSMLSGPAVADTRETYQLGPRIAASSALSSSWLFTGDAHLDSEDAVKMLARHFGRRVEEVSVIALPHHGSRNNFHPSILNLGNPPLFTYASAGESHAHWGHPASAVVKQVASSGTFVWSVTEHANSQITASARAPLGA